MAKARSVSTPEADSPAIARERKSGRSWLWLAALVLGLDQITKAAVLAELAPYQDVVALTGFFNLVHVHNTGAAFSLFADQPGWQRYFFLAIGLGASVLMLYLLRQTRGRPLFSIALALILGGAVGNVIDRALYGHVVDFLDFHVAGWHWPAFNVADAGITAGAVLLVLDSLRKPQAA